MTLTIAQASKWLSPKRAGGGDRAPGVDPRTACPGAVSRTAACVPGEASRFRDAAVAECAFPSRRGAREVWGNPPARLRGTMENASTGQMRSSNPPPACGAACARVRRSRFELDLTERRIPQPPSRGKAHPAPATPSKRDQKAYPGWTGGALKNEGRVSGCARSATLTRVGRPHC